MICTQITINNANKIPMKLLQISPSSMCKSCIKEKWKVWLFLHDTDKLQKPLISHSYARLKWKDRYLCTQTTLSTPKVFPTGLISLVLLKCEKTVEHVNLHLAEYLMWWKVYLCSTVTSAVTWNGVLCFSWTSIAGTAWSGVCVSLRVSSATRPLCWPSSVPWRPTRTSTCVTALM